jgi:glutathione S-transferase
MQAEEILALITVLSAMLTFYLAFNVGMTRAKFKEGALEKMKEKHVVLANRVHMNMVENMVVYLPLLWVASIFGSIKIAVVLGSIWLIARAWYSAAYLKNPGKREIPFFISVICIVLTALVALL